MLLGFPSLVVIVLLIFGLVIRSICRNETDKQSEIAVADEGVKYDVIDSPLDFASVPLDKANCCAVCFCPTATRCSRCKAVRYCSARCQIFHWRQGHKDECQAKNALYSDRETKHFMPSSELKAFSVGSHADPSSSNISQPYSSSSSSSEISHDTCMSEVAGLETSGNSRMFSSSGSSRMFHEEANSSTSMLKETRFADNKQKSSSYLDKEALTAKRNEAEFVPAGGSVYTRSLVMGKGNASHSEVGNALNFSQHASKGLRASIRSAIQHFRPSKYSKSKTQHVEKGSAVKSDHKAIFPYQLFAQLYTAEQVQLYPFGLLNCGNSCYANAVLQCLAFTRPITYYLLQGLHSKTCQKMDWCFICEFESLILKGREGVSPLSPVGILSHIQRIGSSLVHGREEDAHEFLRYAVDTMQSIFLKEAGVRGRFDEDSTLVGLTFGGYLTSKIKCLKCFGRSEQFEWIMDLTVEIDGDIETLEDALTQFTSPEVLDGENMYKCSRCKSYQKAEKKLTVHEAPNILTIILKRFQLGSLGKLNKPVQFPEVLNLTPYISGSTNDKDPVYFLYGVVVHLDMMNAAYSGHYVSYIKGYRGQWFRIDDSRVVPVDVDTVLYEKAYILFYARKTPRAPCLVRNSKISPDTKTKRNLEAISSGNIEKKNDWRSVESSTMVDSSSDTCSIFSFSETGSYSTDSTKDSSAEDITGYNIFGPAW